MYLGLGLMAAGLITLVMMLIEIAQSISNQRYTGLPEPLRRPVESRFDGRESALRPGSSGVCDIRRRRTDHGAGEYGTGCSGGSLTASPVKISSQVAGSYRNNSLPLQRSEGHGPRSNGEASRPIPVDMVIKMAGEGKSELQIASNLKVGRDEVAMVLNLNRLGRRMIL